MTARTSHPPRQAGASTNDPRRTTHPSPAAGSAADRRSRLRTDDDPVVRLLLQPIASDKRAMGMTSAACFMHRPWRTCLGDTLAQVMPADRCGRPGHPANPVVDPRRLQAPRCRCCLKVLGTSQLPQVFMGRVAPGACGRERGQLFRTTPAGQVFDFVSCATCIPPTRAHSCSRQPIATKPPGTTCGLRKPVTGAGCFTRTMRSDVVDLGLVDCLGCISVVESPPTRGSSKKLSRVGERALTCANAHKLATYPPH